MHWYSCNNGVPLVNEAKSQLFQSIVNLKFLKLTGFGLPAVRPGSARCMAPEFNTAKVITSDLRKCYSKDA